MRFRRPIAPSVRAIASSVRAMEASVRAMNAARMLSRLSALSSTTSIRCVSVAMSSLLCPPTISQVRRNRQPRDADGFRAPLVVVVVCESAPLTGWPFVVVSTACD